MPENRVTITTAGAYTEFDPQSPEAFEAAAGSQFVAVKDGTAWVRNEGGTISAVYEGWAVIRPDGAEDGHYRFVSAEVLAEGTRG